MVNQGSISLLDTTPWLSCPSRAIEPVCRKSTRGSEIHRALSIVIKTPDVPLHPLRSLRQLHPLRAVARRSHPNRTAPAASVTAPSTSETARGETPTQWTDHCSRCFSGTLRVTPVSLRSRAKGTARSALSGFPRSEPRHPHPPTGLRNPV